MLTYSYVCNYLGIIAEVAISNDRTRRFFQDRLRCGSETERKLGLSETLDYFRMLAYGARGSALLQGIFMFCSQIIAILILMSNRPFRVIVE